MVVHSAIAQIRLARWNFEPFLIAHLLSNPNIGCSAVAVDAPSTAAAAPNVGLPSAPYIFAAVELPCIALGKRG